ncbi:hypothetical protein [Flavobacterium johnsoniae]|uniref:hypothetical protein n=1 Tax=Flavobacterium johnsoniae TaxID=986 RepID=UPI003D990E68
MTKLTTSKKDALKFLNTKIKEGESIYPKIYKISQRNEYLDVLDDYDRWFNSVNQILLQLFDNKSLRKYFNEEIFFVPQTRVLQQEINDLYKDLTSDLKKIENIITDIENNLYDSKNKFEFSYDGIITYLKGKKIIAILLVFFVVFIGISTGIENIVKTKENIGRINENEDKNTPNDNLFIKIIDVYYFSESSKSEIYPEAYKRDKNGVSLSSDEITQSETMKMLWLDRKPIIKFSISNSNTTKAFKVIGVFIEFNSKKYLLKISTQYDKDEPIICPPNSTIEYTGVPISYPVYKIKDNLLHVEWKPEESQKLYPLYILPTKPNEISGRLAIQFEDSTFIMLNQPFRINKKVIRDLKPDFSM